MPDKNSSITTFFEASPYLLSKSIWPSSNLASFRSSIIKTPLPAARPSAFKTYGGLLFSKNFSPSLRVSEVNSAYAAVGIL